MIEDLPMYFAQRITVDENGCWLWTGPRTYDGYGKAQCPFTGSRGQSAHRVLYRMFVDDIPKGLTIDHLCRVRRCVNPDHLEAVTHAENVRRGFPATKTHCVHGHPLDGVRKSGGGQRYCKECDRISSRRYMQRKKEQAA